MEFGLMLEIRLHLSFVFAYEPKMCMQVFASLAQRIFRWMCVSCSTPQFECGNQISLHLHHNACLAVSPPPLSLPPFLSLPPSLSLSLSLYILGSLCPVVSPITRSSSLATIISFLHFVFLHQRSREFIWLWCA